MVIYGAWNTTLNTYLELEYTLSTPDFDSTPTHFIQPITSLRRSMRSASDSENDSDYVPPHHPDDRHSSGDDEPSAKRIRTTSPSRAEIDPETAEKMRDALWVEFQASVTSPQPKQELSSRRMVKIKKTFRFAGENVVEVREVPEDSDDAKKWPLWQSPEATTMGAVPVTIATETSAESILESTGDPAATTSATLASISKTSKPATKRPGPRRPKTALAPLPNAPKAKKLSTLDKSAMDWRAHVQTEEQSGVKDELAANRRGGGYLEKVEFLQRVDERKADVLDAGKTKRRRG
ncbi:uncharacterized protein FIBRA_02762 [Fibroporia radiculosa]|uniref:SWR1-complex protein 5 n=1 Tax=Fibroporia radiculosa TaxID=599839 RepID=J4HVG2_9APHY|nr:uncharacterized protein FIBRA_02762 [Fibroporia radiculosa]CCM00722.1 predicted protein [Fibroporia radiculosa]